MTLGNVGRMTALRHAIGRVCDIEIEYALNDMANTTHLCGQDDPDPESVAGCTRPVHDDGWHVALGLGAYVVAVWVENA